MDTIYTVTVLSALYEYPDDYELGFGYCDTHCLGWFKTFEEADASITNDNAECLSDGGSYNLIVIEEYWPGLHKRSKEVQWYKIDNNEVVKLDTKPVGLIHVVMFAMG